jgi:hypothetical protein
MGFTIGSYTDPNNGLVLKDLYVRLIFQRTDQKQLSSKLGVLVYSSKAFRDANPNGWIKAYARFYIDVTPEDYKNFWSIPFGEDSVNNINRNPLDYAYYFVKSRVTNAPSTEEEPNAYENSLFDFTDTLNCEDVLESGQVLYTES